MIENKKIVVIGAGGLLGRAVVKKALGLGAKVVAVDIDESRLREYLIDSNLYGESVSVIKLDLTKKQEVEAFFQELGSVDGLINCSYPRNTKYGQHFFDVELDSFNENVSLHLGTAFLVMQQAAKFYGKSERPFSLVNISSISICCWSIQCKKELD